MNWSYLFTGAQTEIRNRLKYGRNAPRVSERIWVRARSVTKAVDSISLCGAHKSVAKGKVISDWPLDNCKNVLDEKKVGASIRHWRDGLSWAATGIYEAELDRIRRTGNADGCVTKQAVIDRYERIESMFQKIKDERRIRERGEVVRLAFREQGGIIIHIGPEGEPYFGCGGNHRFAAAWVLDLIAPCELGCVYENALIYLESYRLPPREANS